MNLNPTQIQILQKLSSGETAKQIMTDLTLSKYQYYKLFKNCKKQLCTTHTIETLFKAIKLKIIHNENNK